MAQKELFSFREATGLDLPKRGFIRRRHCEGACGEHASGLKSETGALYNPRLR